MIDIRSVTFQYESTKPILSNITMQVNPGLTLLLGPNGNGKSTFLKLASGVEKPDSGCIFITGHDLWKNEVPARKNLVYVPEHPDLTPYATLQEIFLLICRLRGEPRQAGAEALGRFGLSAYSGSTIRRLSKGERRRAVFAAACIGRPQNILLDEPLEGMDRNITEFILDWISARLQDGALIIIASHLLEPFYKLADHAIGIREGKAELHDQLPSAAQDKLNMLEALARGKDI